VYMRARLLGSIKWTSAAPRIAQPEVACGKNARDGLEILGWDRQDGSPRCGLGPRRESASRSSRGLSGLGGRAEALLPSDVNIREDRENGKPEVLNQRRDRNAETRACAHSIKGEPNAPGKQASGVEGLRAMQTI
jgi:hypothetical protein